jgi:hypothetical protein
MLTPLVLRLFWLSTSLCGNFGWLRKLLAWFKAGIGF